MLIYVFYLCLRAPRKIDSSIGLPSLNKVVTCLLTLIGAKKNALRLYMYIGAA